MRENLCLLWSNLFCPTVQWCHLGDERRWRVFGLCADTVGVELIFFSIGSVDLCFGFVLERALKIQGCFSYWWAVLTQSQGLSCFSHKSTSTHVGMHKNLGGDTAKTADPKWRKKCSITYGVIHSNKLEGRLGAAAWRLMLVAVIHGWCPVIYICIPWGLFLPLSYFTFHNDIVIINIINTSMIFQLLNVYLNPHIFPLLLFQFSCLHLPGWGSEWAALWCLFADRC